MKLPRPSSAGELIALLTLFLISFPTVVLLWRQTNTAKQAADAATCAAHVAEQTLRQSEDSSSKNLAQMEKQTKSMVAAAKASEDSARVARLALRISERAYVGMASGNGFNFATGSVGGINLVVKNAGRTPALDCVTVGAANIVGRNQSIPLPPRSAPGGPGRTVQPGSGFTLRSDSELPLKLSKTTIEGLKTGKLQYYFVVSVWYRDVFSSKLHNTFVCRQLGDDLTTTVSCPEVPDHAD